MNDQEDDAPNYKSFLSHYDIVKSILIYFLKCEINLVVFLLYREASQHNVKKYISNDVRKSNNLPNLQLLTTNVTGLSTDIVISLNLKQSSEKIGLTFSFIYKSDVHYLSFVFQWKPLNVITFQTSHLLKTTT